MIEMRTKPTPQEHDVLSQAEMRRLNEIIDEADHPRSVLNNWEEEFVDDIRERLAEYGEKTRISGPMWEILNRIEGKLFG
jgi:hypothetical protein